MKLLPLVLALAGLGAGVAAGVVLRPEPQAAPPDCEAGDDACAAEAAAAPEAAAPEGATTVVALDRPFVVPVFRAGRVAAMVSFSSSV